MLRLIGQYLHERGFSATGEALHTERWVTCMTCMMSKMIAFILCDLCIQWEKLQPTDYDQEDRGATGNTGYCACVCVCVCVSVCLSERVTHVGPPPSDEHARMEENRQRSACSLERLVRCSTV